MRGRSIFLVAAVCFIMHLALIANAGVREMVWKDVRDGIIDSDLQKVVVSPDNPDTIYASSLNSVYRTIDGGKTWKEILSFRGTENTINTLATALQNENIILAGTRQGLYRSDNKGAQWARIFRGIGNLEDSIFSIAVHPVNSDIIFIGTGSGLYRTDNNGKDWDKDRNLPAGSFVTSIAIDNAGTNIIYTATDKGMYKSINNGIDWQRIFVTNLPEINDAISNQDETINAEEIKSVVEIKSIVVDPADSNIIFAGTTTGLLVTEDAGLTWKKAGTSGLINHDIRNLTISSKDPDSLFAATGKGVFSYSKASDNWHELHQGLVSADVRFLAFSFDQHNDFVTLWAAAKNGIFKTVPVEQTFAGHENIEAQQFFSEFADEPTIEEIRKAAMVYAEVQPEKIEGWRKAAAKKAFLPDLRLEFNHNKGWQSSTYFYSTKDEKYKDNDITSDRDRAWSVTLTWKLGDLIWNDAQTSIDTRSKLMVELRDDILNEVTRLFFERRRMQIETRYSSNADVKEKIDKELRLQELTADIDSLTGSYLSRRLEQIKNVDKM
jgi:photosystem II stability/assembly factor-like uncharacterized protein